MTQWSDGYRGVADLSWPDAVVGNSFTFQQVEKAFMEEEDLIIKVYKTRGLIKDEDE